MSGHLVNINGIQKKLANIKVPRIQDLLLDTQFGLQMQIENELQLSPFLWSEGKNNSLKQCQSPLQVLEEGPRSRPYLLVVLNCQVALPRV